MNLTAALGEMRVTGRGGAGLPLAQQKKDYWVSEAERLRLL